MVLALGPQSALVGGTKGDIVFSSNALPPVTEPLEDDELVIAVRAVSLNPVDTKMTGNYHTQGAVLGCELAGTVIATGSHAASARGFRPGDRICTVVAGMNRNRPRVGAFSQHTICRAFAAIRIPPTWSFAEAAGGLGGSAWMTVPWALFYAMGLPAGPQLEPLATELMPRSLPGPKIPIATHSDRNTVVLVSGGSSFTGTCAIQLLKLAGFDVVATCSPHNTSLVESFGADAVFDYNLDNCAEQIRAHTRNNLRFVLDCTTSPDSTRLCYAAMGRAGGRYVALDPYSNAVASSRAVVRPDWVFGLELLGEDLDFPAPHGRKANPEAKDFCVLWIRTMHNLLDKNLIRPHPQRIRDTGLQGALEGLEELRLKKISGQKLIYTL